MTIKHHIPDALMLEYASGRLPEPFALVVAAHVSLCDECRARLAAHEMAGGAVMEAHEGAELSGDLRNNVMAMLDDAVEEAPVYERSGIFPAPVMEALKGRPPKWKPLGRGVRQSILSHNTSGSVRLLYIPPGLDMPEHTHGGLELTLVLQGAFSDEGGRFGVGDVEVADDDVDHQPIAEKGEACICLAATDASLKFNSFLPKLFQPIFRI
ncbi:ChrR family anti-sigma-E factor [Lentibacter sp. XHP0401]|jgi:putative transcriptional regulator|uniref:ChrR family anti-sigma-E factor n=1 Tax=Lentibacter sp. XHP0401 TaxID=2984334 RepID=UPI0021E91F0D|nr:ChrR family anti-sigma-E factor [Lentibacter sp. XHP0401]MCV2894782.1 ChrR family anti-sigma-E factor [Lentibacter sp. XHP0401]